jgi:sulfur carrier protein
MTISIRLNGKEIQIEEGSTILDLLNERRIRPEIVVVELDGEIVERERYGETLLKAGDEVELVYYMGGG